MKKIIYLSIIVLTSCHYKNDELKILNNSSSSLCYETVIFNIKDSMYYLGPASDKLATEQIKSPIVKTSIRSKINNEKYNGILYIYFLPCNKREEFWNNTDSIMKKQIDNIKMLKFTEEQLDSIDWLVIYN
ncbi:MULTISPECIES: hypothetical protein [Empedobacter]|uniref:Uncharacterized protein n=1 Tax=Empedobacter falsenii TaxID=343874 RepID=A0A7H9DQC9_9FLAO|nr:MULTISPECIES: hypothetical protein [Empedobacter]QLL57382.1 hypothetical protein FH779_04470 [Empedobacter falsenii]